MNFLAESTSVPVKVSSGRWKATFLTPGQGSSGNWLDETVRRDGPIALKKGAKCFVTHNRMENGEPDPFRMWGVLAEDAYYEEGTGLVGEIDVLPSWRDRVDEVAPHTALSVYLNAEKDANGDVIAINRDPRNGVDLVVHPGRPGSGLVEKLYESAAFDSTHENDSEGLRMEKDVEERFNALETLIKGLADSKLAEAQGVADSAAVESAVQDRVALVTAGLDAIDAARENLLPSQVEALKESAKAGQDITAAIETAKTFATEAREVFGKNAEEDGGEKGNLLVENASSAVELGKVFG